jgi:hypothetical protein
LARALVIPPYWYYVLLIDIREEEGHSVSGWWAWAYFGLIFPGAKLPDPYWLVSLLSFLALLPAVSLINRINRDEEIELPAYASWRKRDAVVLLAGFSVVALAVLGAFGPSTRVLPGDEVPRRHVAFLQEIELVETQDDVLYFYSTGFMSVRGEGTVLTPHGVGAYWTDPENGERVVVMVEIDDILDVVPWWSESWYEDSEVRLALENGYELLLFLSMEEEGDHRFVAELERLRREAHR